MSSSYGENIRLTIFGQSHSPAVGMTLEGIPAGYAIDMEKLQAFMDRRSPGRNSYSTARKEADIPEFVSGFVGNVTCGTPITAIIQNTNVRPQNYENLRFVPRPGHADYTGELRYGGHKDISGGGHFSGRLTAPLCIAGGIILQLLEEKNINVISRILSIGHIRDEGKLYVSTADRAFPVVKEERGVKMIEEIERAGKEGDSLGGVIECKVLGLPGGIGDPIFDGMENRIAGVVFGIPAIKGIEFGLGFESVYLRGSENNDPYAVEDGRIVTATNNCGGILGGITTGMPLEFKVAVKPTPSIAKEQNSVDIRTLENVKLNIRGRHDPCIVPRAVPCVEAAAAIAVYDAMLSRS